MSDGIAYRVRLSLTAPATAPSGVRNLPSAAAGLLFHIGNAKWLMFAACLALTVQSHNFAAIRIAGIQRRVVPCANLSDLVRPT